MNRTSIKLCGFRTKEDVEKAIVCDIDALGFILVPKRKRTVSATALSKMVEIIPPHLMTVGVLMDPQIPEVEFWLSVAPLDVIQLHGEESPEDCHRIKERFPHIQLMKTFHMEETASPVHIEPYLDVIDLALLDATFNGQKGGTGKTFDWSKIPEFTQYSHQHQLPLWIAGGIQVKNVWQLVKTYRPHGIDVSSGVERNGVKDLILMKQLIEKVRSNDKNV